MDSPDAWFSFICSVLSGRGRLRVTVGAKAGLATAMLDYSNIADVDFSTKVLDALGEIQKVAKPENWEVLRPYAEKLLGVEIPTTQDDAVISENRAKLRQLFVQEKESSSRVASRAQSLFDTLKSTNPYETELAQVVKLFGANIEGDDIHLLLYALKEAMGYQAYDTNLATPAEVDDLANRLKNYKDIRAFLEYETELRTAHAYCAVTLGDHKELSEARKSVEAVRAKLDSLKDYIDSDVKQKTELVGHFPPVEGEKDTIAAMIREYSSVYLPMHESVVNRIDASRKRIQDAKTGADIKVLDVLDGITALQPATTDKLAARLTQLHAEVFECPSPSRASVEDHLRSSPLHECGLSFVNASTHVQTAEGAAGKASHLLDEAFRRKMEVFLNPGVRERLEQGKSEPSIAGLLACKTNEELRAYFVKAIQETPEIVDTINKYLKRIVVKRVRIADFRPKTGTIQKDQVGKVAEDFGRFLESQFTGDEGDEDSLPMLQLE